MRVIIKWSIFFFGVGLLILIGIIGHGRNEQSTITWIYYSSEDVDRELYRMRPDGRIHQRLTFTDGWERYRLFSPEWIYFDRTNEYKLYRMHPDGSQQELVLAGYEILQTVTFGPDGQWLYFCDDSTGTDNLYRMRLDGSEKSRLTPLEYNAQFQAFDRAGTWLYFILQDSEGDWALHRMSLDGSHREFLADLDSDSDFHGFSPDQQWIYFTPPRTYQLVRMRLADFSQEQLTPDDQWDTLYNADFSYDINFDRQVFSERMRLGADQQWLYTGTFSPEYGISRMRLDGSDRQFLTPNLPEIVMLEKLSPNGAWVYFSMDVDGISQLFGMRPDGTDLHNLTEITEDGADVFVRDFSPDGQWLYYSAGVFGDVYRIRLDGSQKQNLTKLYHVEKIRDFSLDGEWLYFTSEYTGTELIYKMRQDGSPPQQLTVNTNRINWGGLGEPIELEFQTKYLSRLALGLILAGSLWIGSGSRHHWQRRSA